MKTVFSKTVVFIAALVLCVSPLQAQTNRIGTIDLKKIFDGYWKTKQADAQLKELGSSMDKAHKSMVEDYQKASEAYKKLLESVNDKAVSAEEQEKRKKAAEGRLREAQQIENDIQTYDRSARTQLQEKQRVARDKILGEIRDAVNAKARGGGYSIIIDTAAETVNGTPVILFNNNENDITDEILNRLNTTAPISLPTADDKKGDSGKKEEKKDEGKK